MPVGEVRGTRRLSSAGIWTDASFAPPLVASIRLLIAPIMAEIYRGAGFDFGNVLRYVLLWPFPDRSLAAHPILSNNHLESKGVQLPKATSTGTTIVGCLYKDGIVLGADTRATEGPIVADKNCEKVRVTHAVPTYETQLTILALDPLHYRVNTVLWGWHSRRY